MKHHPALPHAEIADFMADLSERTGVAAKRRDLMEAWAATAIRGELGEM